MPNGYAIHTVCQHCERWGTCHERVWWHYIRWPGVYCDLCMDWIVDDDAKWGKHCLVRAEQWTYRCRTQCVRRCHNLKAIFAMHELCYLIVELIVDVQALNVPQDVFYGQ